MTIFLLKPRRALSEQAEVMASVDLAGKIIVKARQEETAPGAICIFSSETDNEVYSFRTEEDFFDRYANALANDVKTMTIQTV